MSENGGELDPGNRESLMTSMREINEIALKGKAEFEDNGQQIGETRFSFIIASLPL
jgi:hypothetical protein